MLESAVILPVPEAEPFVERFRQLYDRAAALGVPAHLTLLYPFAFPEAALQESGTLAEIFGAIDRFAFSLVGVRRFAETSYLCCDEPKRFVAITETIAARWPQHLPYDGRFAEIIPHLTVADHVAVDVLTEIEQSLSIELPIECRAVQAWLMCSNEDGLWRKVRSFDFA